MFKGFYNLTSSMLTHQQNLNVIANNMANISTAGYKQDLYTASTFDDVMYSRMGNKHNTGQEIGRQSYIRAASRIYTDYTQGILEPTGIALDFAIHGDGFFAVQDPDGGIAYTRMGNFSLDDEGYLCLPGYGQVLDRSCSPFIWEQIRFTEEIREPSTTMKADLSGSWVCSSSRIPARWSAMEKDCLWAHRARQRRMRRCSTDIWNAPIQTSSSR